MVTFTSSVNVYQRLSLLDKPNIVDGDSWDDTWEDMDGIIFGIIICKVNYSSQMDMCKVYGSFYGIVVDPSHAVIYYIILHLWICVR